MRDTRTSVLMFSNRLTAGGAERFVSTLLCNLDRTRFAPEVCLFLNNIDYSCPPDVPIQITPCSSALHIPRVVREIRRLIDKSKPDVVLSNIALMNLLVGEALRGCAHRPRWIARIGNNPAKQLPRWQRVFLDRWYNRVYRQADCLVANSARLAEGFANYFPALASRTHAIVNPIDLAATVKLSQPPVELPSETDQPVVLWVSRLHPQKRPDLLLDAFQLVRAQRPAQLWICGDGPLKNRLPRMIERRKLGDSVHVLGFRKNPYAYMQVASVLLLTSDYEGLPNTLIEGQSLGLPAVSTCCDYGPDEIIDDGRTGFLTPTGDAAALAHVVLKLLDDDCLRLKMARAARERARSLFSADHVVRSWSDLFAGCALRNSSSNKAA